MRVHTKVKALAELDGLAEIVHSAVKRGRVWEVCYTRRIDAPVCRARLTAGTYQCHRCGLAWDTDETQPPGCMKNHELLRRVREELQA